MVRFPYEAQGVLILSRLNYNTNFLKKKFLISKQKRASLQKKTQNSSQTYIRN